MRTHATSCMWKTSLQNCQILENLLGIIEIFLLLKSNLPHTKFDFLQWLSAFFNGFLLSSMAFQFSSTAVQFSSTAFLFPRNPRKSIYGGKYTKDHHSSFVFPATRSLSFVIATLPPSFIIATHSPSFVIATMPTSHPTIRANEIAIENSKTGKVTAVVAILKVLGDKSNSSNPKLLIKPNKWLNLKKKDLN